jgi:Tol biopolymer transport system component
MQDVVRKMGTRRAIILLGVSMGVLSLASGLVSTEPSAQTTSPEGKIVFVKQGTEPSEHCFGQPCADIWVMDADGTNQTNLTNTPDTNEGQPAWSSDGTRIAFTSDQDEVGGFTDIWVMDADGTSQTNLTPTAPDTDNFDEYQPSWAPSGAQLTFVREVPGQIFPEQPDIFVMDTNSDTNDAINLTNTDASEIDPAWSPDGTKIAFAGVRNSGFEIVTMDPDGQNEIILTGDSFDGDDRAPDWSPDSTKVVFMKQSQVGGCCEPWEIWAVNRDGSGDTNLTNHPSDDMGPSWSPDGSEITFTSNRAATEEFPFRTDIYAMPAPTTLPPPSQSASTTTIEQGEGVMGLAESPLIRRLTRGGVSTEPDWGRSARTDCTLSGTSGADVLTGTSGADVICGGGGADLIKGRGGNDTLKGAGGADILYGGLGKDELRGGKGSDSLVGGSGADSLFGGDNNDVLNSRDGVSDNDVLDCGSGTDTKVTDATEKSIVSCEQ